MRILLLSANTGEGHNSTAKALMEVLQEKGATCQIQDCLSFLSPGFSRFISECHVKIYQHGASVFDAGYRFMEYTAKADSISPVYEILGLGAGKLRDLIIEDDFDAVVCVHPFAGAMITEVRKSWAMEVPTVLIATDYTCSPTVEHCAVDTFIVPAEEISGEFTLAGIAKDRQYICGIPVRQAFYAQGSKTEARQSLELPQEGTVVLLMCGSMGCGPIQKIAEQTLEQMPEDSTMVAFCGRNEKLRQELSQVEDPRLRVLGYVQTVPQYMDAADLIITKPGGLSSTEAANKHIPMVFINAVGGCESRNFDYFRKKGYAVGSKDPDAVIRCAIRMIWDRQSREKMRQLLCRDFNRNAAEEIAQHILQAAENYRNTIHQEN